VTYGLGNHESDAENNGVSGTSRLNEMPHSPQHSLAQASRCEELTTTDADLSLVINAWPTLPAPIRNAMLALVNAHAGN